MPEVGTPTPANNAHKRVRWRVPAGGKRRPGVLASTRNELVRGLEQRHGSLWLRVRNNVSIAGYPLARAFDRIRSLRADGAESLLAMTVALLYLADVRTGFIGKPAADGGRWQRYTLHDLAQLAYGAQGTAELRRARRALDMMISLGWAFPTKQVRRHVGVDGESAFRSEPGVRRLNLTRICQMAGTTPLLARDRAHADRTRGDGTASMQEARQQRQKPGSGPQRPTEGHRHHSRPASTGDPPRARASASSAAQHIASIIDALKS